MWLGTSWSGTGAVPAKGKVTGDVSLLGGLMNNYTKREKRVRWADLEAKKDEELERIEAAKDAEFERSSGWQMPGMAPLSRKRLRSPPPAARTES